MLATKATPSFLGLPGELRSEIYRLVHYNGENEPVWIEVERFPTQPAILRVNRQIRNEAISFFDSNHFVLIIKNLKLEPAINHWCWKKSPELVELYIDAPRNWSNFKDWLKKYFNGELLPSQTLTEHADIEGNEDPTIETLDQAFRVVDMLKNLPWKSVEAVLEAYVGGVNASAESGHKIE